MSLNLVALQGRLTKDGVLRYTNSGKAVYQNTIAVNGFIKEDTSFIDFSAWEKQALFLDQYFKKGSEIIISGSLKMEKWQKDGQNFSKIAVNVMKSEFCGNNKTDNQQNNNPGNYAKQNVDNIKDQFGGVPENLNNKINDLDQAAQYDDPWFDDKV